MPRAPAPIRPLSNRAIFNDDQYALLSISAVMVGEILSFTPITTIQRITDVIRAVVSPWASGRCRRPPIAWSYRVLGEAADPPAIVQGTYAPLNDRLWLAETTSATGWKRRISSHDRVGGWVRLAEREFFILIGSADLGQVEFLIAAGAQAESLNPNGLYRRQDDAGEGRYN